MCECQSIGDCFVCSTLFSDIFSHNYNTKNSFPCYIIDDSPCEYTEPKFDYGEFYYVCSECGQPWYFECSPEESTSPVFGIKISDISQTLSKNKINSIKQFLVVLVHEGFSENKCKCKGCINFSLNGSSLCLNHLGFGFFSS